MQPRQALIASLVSAALAIGIVGVDLQYGLEAYFEHKEDGTWVGPGSDGVEERYAVREFGCHSEDVRLVVDNNRLASITVDVLVTYWVNGTQVVVIDDTWSLERGEKRHQEFTIPDAVFEAQGNHDGTIPATVHINAQVGELYASTCVTEATA